MKFTNKEILEAKTAIGGLITERLPVNVSWDLAVIGGKLNSIISCIEPVRQGLFKSYDIYTEASNDGKTVTVNTRLNQERINVLISSSDSIESKEELNVLRNQAQEQVNKFMAELNELMAQEVDIDINVVTIPSKINDKPLEIAGAVLMPLIKFIKVE